MLQLRQASRHQYQFGNIRPRWQRSDKQTRIGDILRLQGFCHHFGWRRHRTFQNDGRIRQTGEDHRCADAVVFFLGFFKTARLGVEDTLTLFSRQTLPIDGKGTVKG